MFLAQGEKMYSQVLNPSKQGLLLESVMQPLALQHKSGCSHYVIRFSNI